METGSHTHCPYKHCLCNPGLAVVTNRQALLWTDGRYHLQALKELDPDLWTLMPQGLRMYFNCCDV